MSDLLTCIPDAHQIPFLLRRGSPVLINGHRRIVSELLMDDGSAAWVAESRGAIERAPERGLPALDLTDETGRWHAARWIQQQRNMHYFGIGPDWLNTVSGWYEALHLARVGADMTPKHIDTLARIVLRLAGRAS
jgi:hypothetical protein